MVTQSRLQELFTLKEETGELFWKGKRTSNTLAGWDNPDGYWRIRIDGKQYKRSRIVYLYIYGYLPLTVDHKNFNKNDDRPSNLREASKSQQSHHQRSKRDLLRGVKFDSRSKINPFTVRIRINGKLVYLTSFPTEEEAHMLYCFAALFFYGDFAQG